MQRRAILMDSWKTSKSTITLEAFRKRGIPDAHKYVPRADEIVPPFFKRVQLPEKNMILNIVTDRRLFAELHTRDIKGDPMAKEETMSTGSEDSSESGDTSLEDQSMECDSTEFDSTECYSSECDSTECNTSECDSTECNSSEYDSSDSTFILSHAI